MLTAMLKSDMEELSRVRLLPPASLSLGVSPRAKVQLS